MYRRLLILSAALAVTGTLLLSCQQEEERIPVLTVPETMITSAGGTQTVAVAAESPWTLSVDYLDKQAGRDISYIKPTEHANLTWNNFMVFSALYAAMRMEIMPTI